MKIYVVNYKETSVDTDNVMNVESGVFEVGYNTEDEAIKKIDEVCNDKMNEFIDDIEDEDCFHECNDNRDWQMVKHFGDEFEYWVTMVIVD